jgi:hypothetical protein
MMTKLTEEERQRLCVAKFRDMSDHMLSEMPGTVMELAEKYVRIRDKFTKTSKFLMDTLPHAPSEMVKHITASILADMVVHGEKDHVDVMEELEKLAQKREGAQ